MNVYSGCSGYRQANVKENPVCRRAAAILSNCDRSGEGDSKSSVRRFCRWLVRPPTEVTAGFRRWNMRNSISRTIVAGVAALAMAAAVILPTTPASAGGFGWRGGGFGGGGPGGGRGGRGGGWRRRGRRRLGRRAGVARWLLE